MGNGGIIGASHDNYQGIWNVRDQYQYALAGTWPIPQWWVPTTSSDCIKHHKSLEDITVDFIINTGSTPWTDQSTQSKNLVTIFNDTTSGATKPMFDNAVSSAATSIYGNNVSIDYHPAVTGSSPTNAIFNLLHNAVVIPSTPSELTVAVLFKIPTTAATTSAPIFSIGRSYLDSGPQSLSTLEKFDFVTDASNNFLIIDGTGGSNHDTGVNAASGRYYSAVLRIDSSGQTLEWNILDSNATTETNNTATPGSSSRGTFPLSTATMILGSGYLSNANTGMTRIDSQPIHYYDVAMFNSILTDAEVAKIQGYHYHKYNITNIPSGHAYASFAPPAI